MRDYLELGPTPAEEDCAQVGTEDYATRARAECERFITLIRATCGAEPEGANLRIKRSEHDFGGYYEVAVYYDTHNEAAMEYAWNLEKTTPTRWAD
jgi:hypothetical protein